MKVSAETGISMPIKNLISIVGAVAIGVWAYFGVVERINKLESDNKLMLKDLESAVEFSIKWPRGELGTLPADSEQFLLIEDSIKDIEKIQEQMESMMHNKVNIERLQKDVDKILNDLEKLKDKVRDNGNHNKRDYSTLYVLSRWYYRTYLR